MAFCLDTWDFTFSMGIYNCRNARGSTSLSHHAEGRALDIGIPTITPSRADAVKGMQVVHALGSTGARLGIDHLIYNRTIWSARKPGGRPYTGEHPHYDHIHAGLTQLSGANLSYGTLLAVIGGLSFIAREIDLEEKEDDMLGFDIGRLGEPSVEGTRAKALQLLLLDRGLDLPEHGADGHAGDETRVALRRFKELEGLNKELADSDGLVGPHTYAALFKP